MEVSIPTYEDLEEPKDVRECFSRVKAEVNAKKYMHSEDYEIFEGLDFDNDVPKNLSQDQLQQLLLEKHQELIALGIIDEQPVYYVTNRSEVRVFDRSVKTCSRFGVFPGSRVNSPKGPGWVVGAFDGYIWFHLEVDYGATYWNNGVDFDAIVNKVGITVLNYNYDFATAMKNKQPKHPTNPDVDIEDTISHQQRRHEMERDSDGEGEHGHQHKLQKHQQYHDSDLEAEETETESDKEAARMLRGNPYPFQAPAWPSQEQRIPVPYKEAPIGMIDDPKIMRLIFEYAAPVIPSTQGYKRVYTLTRLLSLGRVCKKWHEFLADDILWTKALQAEFLSLPTGEWSIKSYRPKEWLHVRHEVMKWIVILHSRFIGTAQEGFPSHNIETTVQEVFQKQPLCDELGPLFVELRNQFDGLLSVDADQFELFMDSLDVIKRMEDVADTYDIDLSDAIYLFTSFLAFFTQVYAQILENKAGLNPLVESINNSQRKCVPDLQQKVYYKRVTIFSFQQLRENLKLINSHCANCAYYLQDFNDAPLEFKCDSCRGDPRFVLFIKILKPHHASFQDPHVRCHYVYFECEKCLPQFFRTTAYPHRTSMMNEYMELMEDPELRKVLKESMAAQRQQATPPQQQEVLTESGEDYSGGRMQPSEYEETFDDWEM